MLDQVRTGHLTVGAARSVVNTMTMRQNNWTLGAYCESYCRIVTGHHTLEDRSVFPHLRRSEPGLGPVLDRLEAEHDVIHDVLEQFDRALVQLVAVRRHGYVGGAGPRRRPARDRPAHRHPALAPGLRGARADRAAGAARVQLDRLRRQPAASSRRPSSRTASRTSSPATTRNGTGSSASPSAYDAALLVLPVQPGGLLVDRLEPAEVPGQPADPLERRLDDHLDRVVPADGEVLLEGGDRVEVGRRAEAGVEHPRRCHPVDPVGAGAPSEWCDQQSRYHRPWRTTMAHGSTTLSHSRPASER